MSNVKNGLKVKQLAKQTQMLKMLMQKKIGWTMSKKINFFIFRFSEAKFLNNFFGPT